MKKSLYVLLVVIFLTNVADAAEALRIWNYSKMSDLRFSVEKGNDASLMLSDTVVTPDGEKCIEVDLKKVNPSAKYWDIQLKYKADGEIIKAGETYDIVFYCKATSQGIIQFTAALYDKPWTSIKSSQGAFEVGLKWYKAKLRFTADKDYSVPLALPRMMLGNYAEGSKIYIGPLLLQKALPKIPLALNDSWDVFAKVIPPENYEKIPDGLNGDGKAGIVKPQKIKVEGNEINFSKLVSGFKSSDCAIIYNRFEAAKEGVMKVGFAADWWTEIYVNGKKIYDNLGPGNGKDTFTVNDHVVEFPVIKGENLLAVKVLSGSNGWRFIYGESENLPENSNIYVVRESKEWKKVNSKFIVKEGTALDFTNLTGKPSAAGTFGRVIVNKHGKLAFEKNPEKAVRFLSFNLAISSWRLKAHIWTKDDIEEFADAVCRQGYNMIRLHYVSRFLLGYKVHNRPLKSISEVGIAQKVEDIPFDDGNIDRLDYLIACFKKRGVYVNLDLMSGSTGYTLGYPQVGDFDHERFDIQLLVNGKYRNHWKIAIEYLMNRKNKYTGLSLNEDPVIALVEPFNEQDLRLYSTKTISVLTPKFIEFLKRKYTTDKMLADAWGVSAMTFNSIPTINEDMLKGGDARAKDTGDFLIELMSETTRWYYTTLKNAGYHGLFSQWDMIMRTMEIPVRSLMPVIAQHAYFSHPSMGKLKTKNLAVKSDNWSYVCGSKKFDILVPQSSSLNSTYFRASAMARFLDRPYLITEYSHSAYNKYRHERGLYFSAYAALQGWDSLAAHGKVVASKYTTYEPFVAFENSVDPISRACEVVSALVWRRGDVKEAEHSIEVKLSSDELFPKHYLAAISDDYGKLSMLTKIGITYPEVKPLIPVGHVSSDLVFKPEDFSPLAVKQWYVAASSKEDGAFIRKLSVTLKSNKILQSDNKTDISKGLYQSETGEILLDIKQQEMYVTSPKLEGVILKMNKRINLGALKILSCSKPASIVVASIDNDKSIVESKRLLLVLSTNALNNNMVFENKSMQVLAEVGSLPPLMVAAEISLKLKNNNENTAVKVYSLNLDGTRQQELACENKDGELHLRIDFSELEYATPFFEIVYN